MKTSTDHLVPDARTGELGTRSALPFRGDKIKYSGSPGQGTRSPRPSGELQGWDWHLQGLLGFVEGPYSGGTDKVIKGQKDITASGTLPSFHSVPGYN